MEGTQTIVNQNPDSITIGTPSKGGEIKVYGDANDVVAFKAKIDNMKDIASYARTNLILPSGTNT